VKSIKEGRKPQVGGVGEEPSVVCVKCLPPRHHISVYSYVVLFFYSSMIKQHQHQHLHQWSTIMISQRHQLLHLLIFLLLPWFTKLLQLPLSRYILLHHSTSRRTSLPLPMCPRCELLPLAVATPPPLPLTHE
jgi:hypothetical protein